MFAFQVLILRRYVSNNKRNYCLISNNQSMCSPMSFIINFNLKNELLSTLQGIKPIDNKKLVSGCSYNTSLVLNDASYRHYHLASMNVISQGELPFLPKNYFMDDQLGLSSYVFLYDSKFICKIKITDRPTDQIIQKQPDEKLSYQIIMRKVHFGTQETKYHVIAQNYIISVTPGIQFGLALLCLRFQQDKWTEALPLPKQYSHYKLSAPRQFDLQIQNINFKRFFILSNGQKYMTINLRKVVINQTNNQLQSTIVKTIALEQRFIMVGFHAQKYNLYIIGNSMPDGISMVKYDLNDQKCTIIHFNIKKDVFQPKGPNMNFTIKKCLTFFDNQFIFITQKGSQKYIAKTMINLLNWNGVENSEQSTEILGKVESNKTDFKVCLDKSGLHLYEQICEPFLQKIKEAPSILQIEAFIKINKKQLYQILLKKINVSQQLSAQVLELL